MSATSISEQAAVLALVKHGDMQWHRVADLVEEAGSATRILERRWNGLETFDTSEAEAVASRVRAEDLRDYENLIVSLNDRGVGLLTVLDDTYPTNLRHVYNRPPFLWVAGELHDEDNHSVAVVGTRAASEEGLAKAKQLATELARSGVTVLSGLALGIDGAAHRAALDAGGRTVAVMGTGVERIYPDKHKKLARDIQGHGALVSQFWPDGPPTKKTFPMRNVVMSGMAIGTVVIEASRTSGARSQATKALDHGKRVFLLRSLVMQEEWAKRVAKRPGVTQVDDIDDILEALVTLAKPPQQLTLA